MFHEQLAGEASHCSLMGGRSYAQTFHSQFHYSTGSLFTVAISDWSRDTSRFTAASIERLKLCFRSTTLLPSLKSVLILVHSSTKWCQFRLYLRGHGNLEFNLRLFQWSICRRPVLITGWLPRSRRPDAVRLHLQPSLSRDTGARILEIIADASDKNHVPIHTPYA